jgi:hypothetical protein
VSAYTTLAEVKAYLNIKGTADDALLTSLIAAASGFIDNYTNRPGGLAVAAYSDVRNGNGKAVMTMVNTPVQSVTGLIIDGEQMNQLPAPAVGQIPGSPFFAFNENTLMLKGACFTKGIQNVGVTYTAGYPTIPAEIDQACIDLVALKYKQKDRIGKTSEALTGIGTVAYLVRELPADIIQVLGSYKRVAYVTDY